MLFNLLVPLADQFSPFNVFRYLTFRSGGAVITALILSFLIAASASGAMLLLSPQRVWLLFVLLGTMGVAFGGFMTLPLSIFGDTIDYDEYRTGRRREGSYWGVAEFCRKVSQGGAFAIIGLTLERLGVGPQEAVFIDDSPGHVAASQALGIHGLHFTTAETLKRELDELLKREPLVD